MASPSPGATAPKALTVAGARRACGGKIPRRRHRFARTRRAHSGRPRALARSCRACGGRRAASSTPAKQARSPLWRERRLAREPVARIIGSKEFWSLKLRIDADNAGAAPGNRNDRRGGAGRDRCRWVALAAPAASCKPTWTCSSARRWGKAPPWDASWRFRPHRARKAANASPPSWRADPIWPDQGHRRRRRCGQRGRGLERRRRRRHK